MFYAFATYPFPVCTAHCSFFTFFKCHICIRKIMTFVVYFDPSVIFMTTYTISHCVCVVDGCFTDLVWNWNFFI